MSNRRQSQSRRSNACTWHRHSPEDQEGRARAATARQAPHRHGPTILECWRIIMDDIFTKPASTYQLSDYRMWRMVLSPTRWQSCALSVPLQWQPVKFDQANTNQVPDNAKGVYTFVVKPEIANHPSCSYLLYVGKAEKQSLQARFLQYFKHKAKGEQSRWVHITEMLMKWDGFLWFYFAEISDVTKVVETEDELLAAYLPPANRKFPAKIRHAVARLFSH
jgi:hypothetical protein